MKEISLCNDKIGQLKRKLDAKRALTTELKVLHGFRSEIEERELFSWLLTTPRPLTIPKPTNRADTWKQILTSTLPLILQAVL